MAQMRTPESHSPPLLPAVSQRQSPPRTRDSNAARHGSLCPGSLEGLEAGGEAAHVVPIHPLPARGWRSEQ